MATSQNGSWTPNSSKVKAGGATLELDRRLTAFGAVVREIRLDRGFTQQQVASKAVLSPGYIGLIETGDRGERPSIETVKKLIQGLGANVDDAERLMRAAGYLGPEEHLITADRPSMEDNIAADPFMSEDQKKVMLDIYRTWVPIR